MQNLQNGKGEAIVSTNIVATLCKFIVVAARWKTNPWIVLNSKAIFVEIFMHESYFVSIHWRFSPTPADSDETWAVLGSKHFCKIISFFNSQGQNPELEKKCHACGKVVFQMEQVKAEKKFWHKNCFRCSECSKQLK